MIIVRLVRQRQKKHFQRIKSIYRCVQLWLIKKTNTTILLYAHPGNDQGGLLYHNIQSDFVSMMGCTSSLNKGPTGTSSSTISSFGL